MNILDIIDQNLNWISHIILWLHEQVFVVTHLLIGQSASTNYKAQIRTVMHNSLIGMNVTPTHNDPDTIQAKIIYLCL